MFRYTVFFTLLCILSLPLAQAQDGQGAASKGFQSLAPHALIMDFETGIVLYEKEAREPIAPASMTKILTAQIVFERLKEGSLTLDTEFTVSEGAWRRGGAASGSSTMFLDVNSSVRVEDLLKGVIIQSGNDACIVLAENISGSETAFADLMTAYARELGLTSVNFKNATGWPDPGHVISTLDLGRLAERTIREFPEFYDLYSEPDFTWNGITQGNRNPLLGRFDGADGLKTGHTEISGYGLVASAERAGTRRIMVVNGLESRAQRRLESQRMMSAAFEQFRILDILDPEEVAGKVPVYMGKSEFVSVKSVEGIKIGTDRSIEKDIKIEFVSRATVPAPIKTGDEIAELIVTQPGREPVSYPLVAAEGVEKKSFIGRALAALWESI